jgi:peptide/nickel transport system permease protein
VLRQGFALIVSVWLAGTLAFWALRILPGDALHAQYSEETSNAVIERKRAALGLDQPLIQQYVGYWTQILRGDWGVSLYSGRSVAELLLERLPNTLSLTAAALLVAVLMGLSLGLIVGLELRYSSAIAQTLIHLALSVPIYWTSTLVVFVIGVRIGGVQGNLLLPSLVLGFHTAAAIARLLYTEIRQIRRMDYIRTAYSKGLPPHWIIGRHILRASLPAIVPIIALQASFLFSGAILTETIFQRVGIGLLLLDAVLGRDYPVVQGVVLCAAMGYGVLQWGANVALWWLDPRVRA